MEKIEFYDDGKYEKYNEINGIKEGKAIYYWGKNSKLTEKDEDYGKVKEEFFYENGVKQGKGISYFDSQKTQKIKEEFRYINNVKHGESYLLYLDRLEKRNYINGKIENKVFVYKINGKAEIKDCVDINENQNKKFRTLKEILGLETNEIGKMEEQEYEILKLEAEKRFREMADFYKHPKQENIIPDLVIKKYYLKYKEMKF